MLVKGLSFLPILAGAIVQGDLALPVLLANPLAGGGAGVPCASTMCAPQGPTLIETTIDVTGCARSTAGGDVELSGTVELTGQGSCADEIPVPTSGTITIALSAAFKSGLLTIATEALNATGTFGLTRSSAIGCTIGSERLDSLSATLNGPLSIAFPSGTSATLDLQNFGFALAIEGFDLACFPTDYTLLVDGDADLGLEFGTTGFSLMAHFDALSMGAQVANAKTRVELTGPVRSLCFGDEPPGTGSAPANLVTLDPLILPTEEFCPSAGTLEVLGNGRISYPDGGADLDDDLNGTVDRSFDFCADEDLFNCAG